MTTWTGTAPCVLAALVAVVGGCGGCTKAESAKKVRTTGNDDPRGSASFVAPRPHGSLDEVPEPTAAGGARPDAFAERVEERLRMVRRQISARGIRNQRVVAAMRRVPRHLFVPEGSRALAYADQPLPIGYEQTISQPYIVAFMTESARPTAQSKCLEIGTGSGYQAAILAEVCRATYSIEYLKPVAEFGARNLRLLGYGPDRVKLRVGDGYLGWPEAAPFDVILVTAAPDHVPQPLLDQLAVGGRLVIPVGASSETQELERWARISPGADPTAFERDRLMGVRFVPFLGERGLRR